MKRQQADGDQQMVRLTHPNCLPITYPCDESTDEVRTCQQPACVSSRIPARNHRFQRSLAQNTVIRSTMPKKGDRV